MYLDWESIINEPFIILLTLIQRFCSDTGILITGKNTFYLLFYSTFEYDLKIKGFF